MCQNCTYIEKCQLLSSAHYLQVLKVNNRQRRSTGEDGGSKETWKWAEVSFIGEFSIHRKNWRMQQTQNALQSANTAKNCNLSRYLSSGRSGWEERREERDYDKDERVRSEKEALFMTLKALIFFVCFCFRKLQLTQFYRRKRFFKSI